MKKWKDPFARKKVKEFAIRLLNGKYQGARDYFNSLKTLWNCSGVP